MSVNRKHRVTDAAKQCSSNNLGLCEDAVTPVTLQTEVRRCSDTSHSADEGPNLACPIAKCFQLQSNPLTGTDTQIVSLGLRRPGREGDKTPIIKANKSFELCAHVYETFNFIWPPPQHFTSEQLIHCRGTRVTVLMPSYSLCNSPITTTGSSTKFGVRGFLLWFIYFRAFPFYLKLNNTTHFSWRPTRISAQNSSAYRYVFALATAICRNAHNSPNWDSRTTRQLGYKHTVCQNVVSTKKSLVIICT
jgi:hypothetical protein